MSFLLTTCHVGAEPVIRATIPETLAGARPAFARPGLVTFKLEGAVPEERPHPLARTWGASLGTMRDADELAEKVASLGPHRKQVYAGAAGPPGRVPAKVLAQWAEEARIVAERVGATDDPARDGEIVVEVVVRPEEPWIAAWHRHGKGRGPLPEGKWPLNPPPDAPSRAWAKLEELVAWSGVTLARGEVALEIGCAPGGATVALLDRGLRVTGIDPQPVELPARLSAAPFVHLRRAVEGVPRDQLPDEVNWLVLDASVAAPVALHALQRLVPRYRGTSLQGLVATLKLNEWDLAGQLPRWLDQLRALGLRPVGAANLPSFRQELGLVALSD
jgi:23S rRNA (cytidine2498-2'-O)-methyltransferase